MKELKTVLGLLVVALVAAVALGVVMTGRSAVHDYYAYQEMVAPRTLHQMTLEMEQAGTPDRSNTLLFGAGLLALVALVFGGFLVAMHGGTAFLKERRLGRKKKRAPRRDYPVIAPHVPVAPLLPDAFPRSDETYANHRR